MWLLHLADKIIFVDHGRKIAEGSKEQLLKSCPEFRQMWEIMHLSEANTSTTEGIKPSGVPSEKLILNKPQEAKLLKK